MGKAKPTIVIVDDHKTVRSGLQRWLANSTHIVGTGGSADAAIALVWQHWPDVVILDIQMPGACPFGAAKRITSETETRVMFYSGFMREDYINRAIAAGATGLAAKGVEDEEELSIAVEHVADGGRYWSSKWAPVAEAIVDGSDGGQGLLTDHEVDLVRRLDSGMTVPEIAEVLDVQPTVVHRELRHVQTKLGAKTRFQMIGTAHKFGLLEPDALA